MPTPRKIAYVVTSTDHGTLIVNRLDVNVIANQGYGVGIEILEKTAREPEEIEIALQLLSLRRKYYGDGVVGVDCGANIGIHTVEWAKRMTGWGTVVAIEAQEWVYYALAGNIAINNCFNARALNAAIGKQPGVMMIPTLNHAAPASFGSLELKKRASGEAIGQKIDYAEQKMVEVRAVTLDTLKLPRVDLIKIDVEGMEFDVLEGAANCIAQQHPVILIEWLKSDKARLKAWLEGQGYVVNESKLNFIAVHKTDKCAGHVRVQS